jgi:hypothetical protein
LAIHCNALSGGVFNSILSNYPNISKLDIGLPLEYQEVIRSICENCTNLQRLEVHPQFIMFEQERDAFFREFYKSEFFTGSHKSNFNLTHLTLERFKAVDSKAEYFKNFKKLKSIKYYYQSGIDYDSFGEEIKIKIDMRLWPGYRLIKTNASLETYDAELKRI